MSAQRPGIPVEVEWTDITGQNGWQEREIAEKQRTLGACVSIGYLLAEDDSGVLICTSSGDFGLVGDSMHIPRRSIDSIRKLRR